MNTTLLLSLFLLPSLSFAKGEPPSLAQGNTRFGLELFRKLTAEPGNVFFSPYSVSSALSMTSAGAKGTTLEQMKKTLNLPANAHEQFAGLGKVFESPRLKIANRLWTKSGQAYHEEFLTAAEEGYGAEPEALDYAADPEAARAEINSWVEEETEGRIKDLMPPGSIKKETDLVLTNAIYFKGEWKDEFRKEATKEESFYPLSGKVKKHSFMHANQEFDYAEDENFQAVRIPYKEGDLAMNLLLPKKGKKLASLSAKVNPGLFENLRAKFTAHPVDLALPKFRMEFEKRLEKILPGMGMKLAFTDKADFSGVRALGPQEALSLNIVAHKAFVEVDEKGTEAAAATGAGMLVTTSVRQPKPKKIFHANRPFLFWIEHVPTKSVLFLGKMAEPAN